MPPRAQEHRFPAQVGAVGEDDPLQPAAGAGQARHRRIPHRDVESTQQRAVVVVQSRRTVGAQYDVNAPSPGLHRQLHAFLARAEHRQRPVAQIPAVTFRMREDAATP